jgi:hypothetical protein
MRNGTAEIAFEPISPKRNAAIPRSLESAVLHP